MKILQLMNRVPWPLKDGGTICNYQGLKGYAQNSCEVTTAALNTSKHHVNELPPELTRLAKWHLTEVDNRVKPLDAFLNLFTSESYNVTRFYTSAFEQQVINLLQKNRYDVIVFESIFMATYLPAVRKHTHALCVLRAHNVECDIWKTLYENEKNPIKKWYLNLLYKRLKAFEQKVINDFDLIVPITDTDKYRLVELGCARPQYVSPMGANIQDIPSAKIPAKPDCIYHLGSMEWMPNQEAMHWFIQEVWPDIHKRHPGIRFYLAGRGMPQSFMQMNIDGIQVDGEVPDASEYVSDKHIMVVPLFAGSGMRIKIIEAMARGKVIIATPLGAQGIHGVSGTHFIICQTADEFSEAINRCLTEEGFAAKVGEAARQFVLEHFDNNKVSVRLLNEYRNQLELKKK